MIYPKNWEKVTCHDWYSDEKKIWLCLENKNAICEIDKKDKNVKILGSFPHNGLGDIDLSLSLEKCGDYIIFCPFKANDIAVLNRYTGSLEFIDLLDIFKENKDVYAGVEKFYRMVSHKNYVYFFGIKYPAIMRLDLITKKIELFDEWLELINKYRCKDAVLFTDGYARNGNEIYLPIGRCNGVLKINLDTINWNFIEIKYVKHGILGMTQKDNYVWFTEYDIGAKNFFQWNLKSGEIVQIKLPCKDAFYAPLYYDKSLMFFRNYGEKSFQYNLISGDWIDIASMLPGIENSSDKKVQENKIDYFANKSKRFYHWDTKKNTICYDEILIKEKDFLEKSWDDYCKQYKQKLKDHVTIENRLTIKEYIEIIGNT